jgi:hypothetical protein
MSSCKFLGNVLCNKQQSPELKLAKISYSNPQKHTSSHDLNLHDGYWQCAMMPSQVPNTKLTNLENVQHPPFSLHFVMIQLAAVWCLDLPGTTIDVVMTFMLLNRQCSLGLSILAIAQETTLY